MTLHDMTVLDYMTDITCLTYITTLDFACQYF